MRYFILVFLLMSLSGFSQTVSKQVISPLGGTAFSDTHKLSYTTGEVVVGAMTSEDGSIQLGNGYYPSLDLSTLNTESAELQLQVKVFPNPTTETIFITHPISNSFKVFISDLTGKVLLKKEVGKQEPINIESYPTGAYLINVTTEDKKTNTYKIIKQ
ncbi:T9SS type A sorting domain-containing protein [Flavobacteriaceae bacterium]|jgi:hypothetical protein|nr:T9SS type A sorting domain-containing protein [Flavobacteriaceae bacterium]MDC1471704.1 T9SS type A sorting domain-containing protein [Flavobacteriaceae bacterium]